MSSQEVEAVVLEPAAIKVAYTPAVISDNLAALNAYVDNQLEIYIGAKIDPEDDEQVKMARSAMAALNDLKKPIEDERKRIKREYEAPLKAFEGKVKEITSKIEQARNAIKDQVDKANELFRDKRRAMLFEEYLGCAGILTDVLSFDALLDPSWLNRSTTESKAIKELFEKVESSLSAYTTLQKAQLKHPDEVIKKFADTLDLGAALAYEEELNIHDLQMQEFNAAREKVDSIQEPAKPVYRWTLAMEFTGTRDLATKAANALKSLGITGATIKRIEEVTND